MEAFRNRHIGVIGAARSGIAAAHTLTRLGADVLLSDSQTADKLGAERLAEIAGTGAKYALGAGVEAALPRNIELVVTSPGVPKTADVLQEAVRRGIPVWSEIELAYRLARAPIIATTGTNGKTTTTLLIAAMLQEAGFDAVVAGNVSADEIKCALVQAAVQTAGLPRSVLVAEISSFQLEWVETFAPKVAILTNMAPDHLNRHSSLEEYAGTKARIFAAQTSDDWAVLNFDNALTREIGESGLPGKRVWFSRTASFPEDTRAAWVRNAALVVRLEPGRAPIEILPVDVLPPSLPGAHSVENVLAAAVAALACGAAPEAIAKVVRQFGGVAHRMEIVAEIGGVRYINNSMCTNIAAAVSSLASMDRPAVVIAGGSDKGLDFAPLVPVLKEKARHVLLIGQTAGRMEAMFRAGGYTTVSRADSLEEAVAEAAHRVRPGDAVLLSPACASFGMFHDFEERGAAFRAAVRALSEASE